ncbi:MAG: HIT domain-containing protein [Moraxella sp.]|nr:HIT domain-containing protein [Moraxella sp.]
MIDAYKPDNIFQKILKGEIPAHKVYEDEKTLAFMDIMPVADGHVLVIPKCEAVELSDLPADYALAVFETAKKVMTAQRHVLNTEGIVQMQLNHAKAGQSVFHYHMHLIPTHLHNITTHESTPADHAKLAELASKLSAAIA